MSKIPVSYNKTLKLSNACIYEIVNESDFEHLDMIVARMENYIRSKGAVPIGPFVQYTSVQVNDAGEPKATLRLIRQSNKYIANVEPPYKMESILRCKNCLFARFEGEEDKLEIAFNKLNVIAYEEGIPLTGVTYTVFTAKQDDTSFSADVFMEKAEAS